jgi:peptide/nickel transport system permease protein
VHRGLVSFVARRILQAVLLVFVVSSAALLLVRLAPGDHLSGFDTDPAVVAAERHRLGLDRPFAIQYLEWLGRAVRLDFGESLKYRRPVRFLVTERAANTLLLGTSALVLATLIGLPIGIMTGSGKGGLFSTLARATSIFVLSVPPLVTSFALLLVALTTGWLPVGGFGTGSGSGDWLAAIADRGRYLVLPTLALALPIAASLERLQSRAMRDALAEPCIRAALGRGLSSERVIWRHGLRLSLAPVLGVFGALIGSVLSGSFVVEIVMSWPGLGALMYEALVNRDLFLAAGCAAAGSVFLAAGVLGADIALVLIDPRVEDAA